MSRHAPNTAKKKAGINSEWEQKIHQYDIINSKKQ